MTGERRLRILARLLGNETPELETKRLCEVCAEVTGMSGAGIMLMRPLGLFDFVALEQRAMLVVTDSGTVQEECCIFGIPNITARDTTERPETLECGSNILAGVEPDALQRAAGVVLARKGSWSPPPEYLEPNVSATVANILLGYLDDRTRRAESGERQRPAMHDSLTAP